ncbi:hypothetical protein HBI71_115930 [Parastagonospora nodorum]|nr:hypothetical protein HBI76_059880 [Parastagonospora nodorum]KAH5259241.1 hypothetical protein HBI71_115930 [Parastagonospora nodorum]
MSQDGQSSAQQSMSPEDSQYVMDKDMSRTKSDEWSEVKDPSERRKIQNKLAQRRFRDKAKEQREESDREAENQRRASSAYASPEPEDIENSHTLSGLPWGGISMRHVVEKGKNKEQSSGQSSRENSVHGSATRTTGGSGRLGLRLTDQFARGPPPLGVFRYFPVPPPNIAVPMTACTPHG